jgi:hypothetical protein
MEINVPVFRGVCIFTCLPPPILVGRAFTGTVHSPVRLNKEKGHRFPGSDGYFSLFAKFFSV